MLKNDQLNYSNWVVTNRQKTRIFRK